MRRTRENSNLRHWDAYWKKKWAEEKEAEKQREKEIYIYNRRK